MNQDVKVFGMPAETGRWWFVIMGLVINICLGTVYSWSVFKVPLQKLFQIGATESGLPYMFFLTFFAVLMPLTGGLLDKYGPKMIMLVGSIVVGAGWILSSFASNTLFLNITYGVIAGSGVGIAYGGPIAVSTRWFPDKKGLAVGLTVLGFGMSALVTAPLARSLIASKGLLSTFSVLGIAFIIILVVLSIPMRFPPAGWKPAGWTPSAAAASAKDYTIGEMLGTPTFYGVWLCYIIGSLAGLMAVGIASPVGTEIVKLNAATAALFVSIFAIFNGIGRPIFGWLTDRITARNAAILSFVIIFLASIGMKGIGPGNIPVYAICFAGFWLCLGGWIALAPTCTGSFFGAKNYSKNYGIVFTAYGVGAIIGTLLSGRLRDLLGSYLPVFNYTAIMALVGLVIAVLLIRSPNKK